MLGIDVNRTIALTFFIGSAMAGRRRRDVRARRSSQISNTIGFLAGLKAFTAAVVGGIGSIPGRDDRRPVHRPLRVVQPQLHLDQYSRPDRVRDPDRDDADPARPGIFGQRAAAEGLSPRMSPRSASTSGSRAPASVATQATGLRAGCSRAPTSASAGGRGSRSLALVGLRRSASSATNVNLQTVGVQLPAVRDPRARAQHRRRLGRPARPRLHRVLRLRRVRLRALLLARARHRRLTGGTHLPAIAIDPDRGRRRGRRRRR